jgi:hypothetical protein
MDRLISKVDTIRQRVNVDKVGVRRFRLYRVIRTWSGGEVGDGTASLSVTEITPAPAITLGKSRDAMNGRGRVEVGSMVASEISLSYTEADLQPTLTSGQELYYRMVEMNDHGAHTTYWHLMATPEADRCETPSGNLQWILSFQRAQISE